jgi:predicted nucleic acid-binding protein
MFARNGGPMESASSNLSAGKFLLDTDVIIWHLRGRQDVTRALRELQAFGVPACSALSVLEVQVGLKKGEEERTAHFLSSLSVIAVTKEIAERAALEIRDQRAQGITIDIPDAIIAATCLTQGLTLVTYNKKHYPFETLIFHPLPVLR